MIQGQSSRVHVGGTITNIFQLKFPISSYTTESYSKTILSYENIK